MGFRIRYAADFNGDGRVEFISDSLLVFGAVVGCGNGRPKRVPVSGVVLIDGKPLTCG